VGAWVAVVVLLLVGMGMVQAATGAHWLQGS
jgi:hypothetical protein